LYINYNIREGEVSDMKTAPLFGDFFKQKRIERGLTLREFCRKFRLDPGNLSKLERGILSPPDSSERLEEYAGHLGLKRGTDDWYQFFDLAAAAKGRIPRELLDDEELVRSLPIVFRAFRGKKVTEKAVRELVEKLRKT